MEGAQIVAAREESARPDAVIGGLTRSGGPNDQLRCTAAAQTSKVVGVRRPNVGFAASIWSGLPTAGGR
jgi:hypothetical protein